MTKQEFMRFCENYYGEKYGGIVFDVMDAYLGGKSAGFLDSAAAVLVKRFSRANRIAPGPAEIEKYRDEILDNIPDPTPLAAPAERISDEERAKVSEMLHNLTKKISVSVG
ncbi:MAG: hypothetical protein LBP27_05825 [Treponema sp.]|jgi:hypothetical protein|nr:hypothetical protein [Treponema sp.]